MLLYRIGPEGFYAATDDAGDMRVVYSDPFQVEPGSWELGRVVETSAQGILAPIHPGKIIGIGAQLPCSRGGVGQPGSR